MIFLFAGHYMPCLTADESKLNLLHDSLLMIFFFNMMTMAALLQIFIIVDSKGTIFVGSSIPPGPFLSPLKNLIMLLHCYIILVGCLSCTLFNCYAITYGFNTVLFYTVELRLGLKEGKYRSEIYLRRSSTNMMVTYRAFQILHKHFLVLYGPFLLTMNAMAMLIVVYNNFVLIQFWNELEVHAKAPLLLGLFLCLSIWSGVIELGRILFSRGKKVVNSWKGGDNWSSSLETKVMQKFRRSCKPLLLAFGTEFVLRKGSIFIFFRGVTRGTCRVLLTAKR